MQPRFSSAKLLPLILPLVVVLVLVIMALRTFAQIGTGEVGVVTRFGQVTGRELDEGFNWKAPWEDVTIYTVRVQKDAARAEAATNDLQEVTSTLALNFHLDRGRISSIHHQIGPD